MSVHVDIELDDATAAVLGRDADQRGITFGQAVAEHLADTARRVQAAAIEAYFEDAERERAATVYA
jgi:predicted transcriptional regulator